MMKIKKVVSLTLAFIIVMSSVSTVAYADESTRDSSNASSEKMVAYAGDLMTEEEAKELAASMELAESNDFFSVDEELESVITFTSDSEVEAYIKDNAPGACAHKPGSGVVSFVDDAPKVIYNPKTANFDNNYPEFICYYVIKVQDYPFY